MLKVQLRRINTSLLQLACAFLMGSFLGLLLNLHSLHSVELTASQGGFSPAALIWLPTLSFVLGTSILGYWVVPLLVFLRGYMLTASFSILLSGGIDVRASLLMVALPAVFSVPALFLLAEDAVSASRILCVCTESGLMRSCAYIRPARLITAVLLLLAAAAVQIYLVPQIV